MPPPKPVGIAPKSAQTESLKNMEFRRGKWYNSAREQAHRGNPESRSGAALGCRASDDRFFGGCRESAPARAIRRMYLKQLTLINTGPISRAVLDFPTSPATNSALIPDGPAGAETPLPIVIVGENGAGKSICLSHIVNTLMGIQQIAYPGSSETRKGTIYKIASQSYIKMGASFYYSQVVFSDGKINEEIALNTPKHNFKNPPDAILNTSPVWKDMEQDSYFSFSGFAFQNNPFEGLPGEEGKWCQDVFKNNCVLYFPPNRFEDPAWLNEEHLKSSPRFLDLARSVGSTDRTVITYHPMRFNQNWMLGVFHDHLIYNLLPQQQDGQTTMAADTIRTSTLSNAIHDIFRDVRQVKVPSQFRVSARNNRAIQLVDRENNMVITPNIFQMSAGETALLNLFLSILRDADMSQMRFVDLTQIRGMVVVDEVDLHLHSVHQYEILPALIKMFPRVQFIMTSHSPLFVLGMQKQFGDDGFVLYRLPEGEQIAPEEFGEFGRAYDAFRKTRQFNMDIRKEIKASEVPILFVEGTHDVAYMERAAQLLGREEVVKKIRLLDGGGAPKLHSILRNWTKCDVRLLETIAREKIILLADCDATNIPDTDHKGKIFSRKFKKHPHPLGKGIENMFSEKTLNKVREKNRSIFQTVKEIVTADDGDDSGHSEQRLKFKDDEQGKRALREWLCQHGDKSDFHHFGEVFDMLEDLLNA